MFIMGDATNWLKDLATTAINMGNDLKIDCHSTSDSLLIPSIYTVYKTPRQLALVEIKKVIFNNPATIVFWADGTKTVVKAQGDDKFDPEKGLAMAISKKYFGNHGFYCDVFKKFLGGK